MILRMMTMVRMMTMIMMMMMRIVAVAVKKMITMLVLIIYTYDDSVNHICIYVHSVPFNGNSKDEYNAQQLSSKNPLFGIVFIFL
jgi:hypothetical protein